MISENFSRHLVINFKDCDGEILKDRKLFSLYVKQACKMLKLGKIKNSLFSLNPNGITFNLLLKNCQFTIISNNTTNVTTINLFTNSKNTNFHLSFNYLTKVLKATSCEIKELIPNNFNNLFTSTYSNSLTEFRLLKNYSNPIISILGSAGGVAKSLLSILNKAAKDKKDPIYNFISTSTLHLIDIKQKNLEYYESRFSNLKDKIILHEFDLNDLEKFTNHLKETHSSIVIDISFADTVDTLNCCDKNSVIYINSAFESIAVDEDESLEGFPLQERYEIFESHRDEFKNTSAIICSGMNPGIVQWMAIELMKKSPNELPKGCYIVEEDTTFFENEKLANKDTIYTTWSPECFLDEAIYSYPNFVKDHKSLFLYNDVYELEFKVTLGEKTFYGSLMPHEEALTLGKLFNMETGFIYKINNHTTNLIKSNLNDVNSLWDKPMSVLDPEISKLKGEDLVGILLVYDNKELYMYNSLSNEESYNKYKTNATYIQVAAGLYGALATILLDEIPIGIYYIDELLIKTNSNYGKYLTYHLENFIIGENKHSDGTLLKRMVDINLKK